MIRNLATPFDARLLERIALGRVFTTPAPTPTPEPTPEPSPEP